MRRPGSPIEMLPPRMIPWTMKDISTAATDRHILADGRLQLRVRHDVLRGVTPKMLVWWFENLEGDMEIGGKSWPRYQIWHPIDHFSIRYEKLNPDGKVGPGTRLHIREVFGGRLDYFVEMVTTIEKLDETGLIHVMHSFGMPLVRLEHTFSAVAEGTIDENSATFGTDIPLLLIFNRILRPLVFSDDKAQSWFKHNVEEIGNFEFFLPELYSKHKV